MSQLADIAPTGAQPTFTPHPEDVKADRLVEADLGDEADMLSSTDDDEIPPVTSPAHTASQYNP